VLAWSVEAVASVPGVIEVVVACHPGCCEDYARPLANVVPSGVGLRFVPGGDTRQQSVSRALRALPGRCSVVIVHDGARPLVETSLVADAVGVLLDRPDVGGVVVGHPSVDTLKRVSERGGDLRVVDTPERSEFWTVQTPQVFRAEALRAAHEAAEASGVEATDDAALVESRGGVVIVFEGPRDNIKITHEEDLAIAEAILLARARGERS
jgi:2-C-methyl-D-erythritol 4-phosphate cytidylyltransferase